MTPRPRTLIVFGAGPGIGNHTASSFSTRTPISHIILLARNTTRLTTSDAPFVSAANPSVKVDTLRVDLADLDSIPEVLKELDSLTEGEDVEVIFFNAARIKPSNVLEVPIEEIDEDLKTSVQSLYLISQHFLPRLQSLSTSTRKPALLVTNSHLPWDPAPQLLSLSLVKAAQRNMVQSFHLAFAESGVHIGLVNVQGSVAEGNKVLNPGTIGKAVVGFWEGGGEGGLDLNLKEE